MFTRKQLLLGIGLTIISKVVITAPANAFPDNLGVQIFNSPPSFAGSSSAKGSTGGGVNTGEALTSGISIPPGMTLPSTAASSGSSSGSSSGISGDGNTSNTGDGSSSSGDGNTSNTGDGSSSSGTVTVADIAEYFASSIDRSLDELDTSNIAQRPRRIVRRRSVSCPNPQASRSSQELDDLLSQSEKFIEQVNQLKPENSAW